MDRFLPLKEVCYVTSLSKTEIMGDGSPERPGRVALGTFPKPTRLGKHRNSKLAWRESWIEKWMKEQEANGYGFLRTPAKAKTPDEKAETDLFMTLKEVCEVTKLGRTDIIGDGSPERPGRVASGTFPMPWKIGPHRTCKWLWRQSAIEKYMADMEAKYPWTPPQPANDKTPDRFVPLKEACEVTASAELRRMTTRLRTTKTRHKEAS
jgi:predicted DNA-binding transcriptional regulator AlpA